MIRVAITGGYGFLGWHTSCRLAALHKDVRVTRIGHSDFEDGRQLADVVAGCDAVIHIAGVNRADGDERVEQGNISIAEKLVKAMRTRKSPLDVVYANSIQAQNDTAYGRGKAQAAVMLGAAARATGGAFADLLLPNIFGEHGRPGYNSFVASFAHAVITGGTPTVSDDREIPLLHVQDAAQALVAALGSERREVVQAASMRISDVLSILHEFHSLYAVRGDVPDISTRMRRDLFNTYRAAAFPGMWPISPRVNADSRGDLFETVRAHGGTGMAFMSTTLPGQTRGEHYHLRKVERFFVVKGEAEIRLRRLLHDEVVSFRLSGDRPSFVDMPTLWVHNIINVGKGELITMFWANQLLDLNDADQFPETIVQEART